MIKFAIVGSGSKGNATLVFDEDSIFQIDMGISLKRVESALSEIKRKKSDLLGILFTHNHSDHISTLKYFHGRVETFSSENTLECPDDILLPYQPFSLGSFTITPLKTSHDAPNPVGFLVQSGNEKLVYMTDTGFIPEESLPYMRGADYYIIESNHDYKMLLHSSRPASLKHRIHSDFGHLSNSDSASYLADLVSDKTKGIYLAHLSEECNTPELALASYEKIFKRHGLKPEEYGIICAKQYECVFGGDK